MTKRTWVVSLGDSHCGLKYGMLMPETIYHEKGPTGELVPYRPEMTETQKLLLRIYEDGIQSVRELAQDDDIVVIHGGDICHGNRHPDQLQTTRVSDQAFAGADVLKRWAQIPNVRAIRIAMGTDAHNIGEGSLELLVSEMVNQAHPAHNVKISTHWKLDIAGVTFDVAHHGPGPGMRFWTSGNVFSLYVRSLVDTDIIELGEEPVDVVLRYHTHTYCPVSPWYCYRKGWRQTLGFIHPPMCGMNFYGVKATQSRAATHLGFLAFCIEGGHVVQVVDNMVHVLDQRTKETVL